MDNNKLKNIEKAFFSTAIGLKKQDDFYIYKTGDSFGVAIENKFDKNIDESFSNVEIKSEKLLVNNEELNLITLMSSLSTHKSEFALFCMQFVDNVNDGEIRDKITKDPLEWWKNWRDLIGNKISKSSPYDVISELIVIEILANRSEDVKWEGPNKTSIDIVSNNKFYEVKSSRVRYENEVTISSQFQLEENFKDLYLIFVKLEKLTGGETINKIVERLRKSNKVNIDEIEKKLHKKGYRKDSSNRDISYVIHEIRCYNVQEDFPKITLGSFKKNIIHENITKISYTISLNGIKYYNWKDE